MCRLSIFRLNRDDIVVGLLKYPIEYAGAGFLAGHLCGDLTCEERRDACHDEDSQKNHVASLGHWAQHAGPSFASWTFEFRYTSLRQARLLMED
jgi:hypothetical protein